MTKAEQILERFGDGGTWEDADGVRLMDVLREEGLRGATDGDGAGRYELSDGSVIVVADGGWDIGYADSDCTCMAGAGHICHGELLGPGQLTDDDE